ncbi:MAG: polysaccharide deacetylase family protein [Phycisphaerae bacterium]
MRRWLSGWRRRFDRGAALPPGATLTLSFDYERGFAGEDPAAADAGLSAVLELLARHAVRATFNCVARIAEVEPARIAAIAAGGHEVACHGYTHESPRDLSHDALDQMLDRCRTALASVAPPPVGFRAPQSHWTAALLDRLPRYGFRYDAEHDRADRPYALSAELIRMPVATDDWDFVRHPDEAARLRDKHVAVVDRLAERGACVALGYHPWLLADAARLAVLDAVVERARQRGVAIRPFFELLAAATL